MTDTNHGRFVWYDLLTTDPQAAMAFYSDVIGWKTRAYAPDGSYTMWVGNQGPLGGVMTLPEQAKEMGAPSHWMANVEVADLAASVARVRALGGRIFVEPKIIPEIGSIAVIGDPQGAAITLFTPSATMASHDSSKAQEFTWNELITTDHEAAFAFYSAVFGWEMLLDHDMGPMGAYRIFGRHGQRLGGMFTKPAAMAMPPAWLHYVQVDDLDAAIARAKAGGATLKNGPMEVPGGALVAHLTDAQGAAFALHANGPKA